MHINSKYLEKSKETSLEPDVVVPYLKQHLSWAVIKVYFYSYKLVYFSQKPCRLQVNGEVVDLHEFPSLEVTVLCTPLTLPVGAEYPVKGQPNVYPDITRRRVGGEHAA